MFFICDSDQIEYKFGGGVGGRQIKNKLNAVLSHILFADLTKEH